MINKIGTWKKFKSGDYLIQAELTVCQNAVVEKYEYRGNNGHSSVRSSSIEENCFALQNLHPKFLHCQRYE